MTKTSSSHKKGQTESAHKNNGTTASKNKKSKCLEDLFEEGLKDMYSAETQLVEALPELAKAAHSEDLQDAFTHHLEQTKRHVQRIEKAFVRLKIDNDNSVTCEAMKGLIKEGNEIIEEFEESPVRDSALIIGAQKVEHYEIASYGSLCELADVLGYTQIKELLGRTLEEEEDTDKTLTELSQDINDEAYELSHEEQEEEQEA